MNSNLKIFYQNVQSIKNKESDFISLVCGNSFDIICLTETWLSSDTLNILDTPKALGWSCFTHCRDANNRGGGILILLNPRFIVSHEFISASHELLAISCVKPLRFCIALLYMPPNIAAVDWDLLLDQCNISNSELPWIFLGDFNIPSWNKSSSPNNLLCSTMEHNLTQIINFPTRRDNFLDLIFIRYIHASTVLRNDWFQSDHNGVEFDIFMPLQPIDNTHRIVPDYFNTNWLRLNHLISDLVETDKVLPCSPTSIDFKISNLLSLVDSAIPKKKIRNNSLPWMDSDLLALCKRKNRFHKIWKIRRSQSAYDIFSELRTQFKAELLRKRELYLISNQKLYKTDSRKFWKLYKPKSNSSTRLSNPSAQDFANHFSSLLNNTNSNILPPIPNSNPSIPKLHSFPINVNSLRDIVLTPSFLTKSSPDVLNGRVLKNCSSSLIPWLFSIFEDILTLGYYPTAFKKSSIFPLHKKGDKTIVSNYRQITIQPLLGKILDKLLYSNIYPHISPLIQNYTHYGIKKRSINTNLACTMAYILNAFEKNHAVDVVYADLEKAFDNISHDLLLFKLEHQFGISGTLLILLKSYFDSRVSFVVWNGIKSMPFNILKGIPQGGILSPLFFVTFLNDLITFDGCLLLTYADDVKFLSARPQNAAPTQALINSLRELSIWSSTWGLSINPNKSKLMTFSLKRRPIENTISLFINSTPIEKVNSFTDLGIIFDPMLTFSEHIGNLNLRLRKAIGFLKYNFRLINDPDTRKLLYYAIFQSKLDFGISIWSLASATNLLILEKTHKRAIKHFLLKIMSPTGISYNMICKKASILPIKYRAFTLAVPLLMDSNIPQLFYLIPQKTAPRQYMATRSSPPFIIQKYRLSITERSLRISLPNFLNSLPSHLLPSLPFQEIWKGLIKQYLIDFILM